MSLISIQAVSKHYFGHTVLDQVSFQLDRGERLCLIGNNGAGKTTLLRLIMGSEKPDSGTITMAGTVICGYLPQSLPAGTSPDEQSWVSPEIRQLETAMHQAEQAMAIQGDRQPDDPAIRTLLAQYADLTARYEAAGGYEHRHLMEEALGGLGLTGDILERPLSTLSGGERMRVALARLIIKNPDLLLLDEPTNHLDLSALEWLEQYLVRFKGTSLLISHDRMFIDRTATAVGELNDGHITIRPGGYKRFIEQAAAEALTLEREIKKVSRELDRQQEVVQTMLSHRKMSAYHAREKVAARLAARLGEIVDRTRYQQQNLSFRFLPGLTSGDPDRVLLKASSITGGYGGSPLFRDVAFELRARSRTCLCGPNGCGKTTLLNLLRGRHEAMSGQVRIADQIVCGHLGQQVDFADEGQTVLGELLSRSDMSEGQARDLLARYGFRDTHVFKQLSILSGGERSRLYLACLLLEQPNILFLDEPTNHLDIYSREILEQALLAYEGAILAVSHDRMFIDRCCDRILGFISTDVRPFDTFEAWRAAARSAEIKQTAEIEPPRPEKVRPDDNKRQNRASERREIALHKEKLRSFEAAIEALELEKAQLEATFGADTDPAHYQRYAAILTELDGLYAQYLALAAIKSSDPAAET
jgi:ATP-binding cassette subfamily F protein 3